MTKKHLKAVEPEPRPTPDPERDAVLAVLDWFLVGLRTKNFEIWDDLFMKEGAHYAFRKNEEGKWIPNFRKPEDWLAILAVEEQALDQSYWSPTVFIRGPIAVVWTPYEIFRDHQPVHCGIDSITLLKIKGEWKIFSYVSTQEPDSYEELRLKPKV